MSNMNDYIFSFTVFPQIVAANFNFLPNKLNFCCGKYSREETIQGRKLYEEILYLKILKERKGEKCLTKNKYLPRI